MASEAPRGFRVRADVNDYFYLAASHRPVVRSVEITNESVDPARGDVVLRVSVEAEEPLVHVYEREIPSLEIGESKTFRAIRMLPNFVELARLDEQLPANLLVEVLVGGETVGHSREPVTFLAYNQWMHRPEDYDSYSAFVLPHHPALAPVMNRVRRLLEERTEDGDSSTGGYQNPDPRHLLTMANAVYDALAELKLDYTDPPASFEGMGQKIRTPDRVLEEGAATCLDSSVLMASCLEAAGLDSVLVLVQGHAFAGLLMREHGDMPKNLAPVIDNPNDILDLYSNGAFVPIETTTITAGNYKPFEEALVQVQRYFGKKSHELEGVVIPELCGSAGVRPLPARRLKDGAVVEIVAPPDRTKPPKPQTTLTPEATEVSGEEGERLEAFEAPGRVLAWMDSLLDLTFRNRLLRMPAPEPAPWDKKKRAGMLTFDLVPRQLASVEDRLMSGVPVTLLPGNAAPSRLLDAGWAEDEVNAFFEETGQLFWPAPLEVDDVVTGVRKDLEEKHPEENPFRLGGIARGIVADLVGKALDKRIKSLRNAARDLEAQTGSNHLFATIGTLSWKEPGPGNQIGRAPLFLIPVRVSGKAADSIVIEPDEPLEITPNFCLAEKLRRTFEISIPELETPLLDEAGIDVNGLLSSVRQALSGRNIKDAVVTEEVGLAVLNFSTFRLWKDMRDHWEDFMGNPVVAHLVNSPGDSYVDPTGSQTAAPEVLCPIEWDESQLQAVRWAIEGRSFVLEGPPGTGKSQTIANILAACMAAGRKVLFVAEKQVALTVVEKRLDKIGLSAFCLELHDKGSKTEKIRTQLREALDFTGVDRSAEWTGLNERHEALDNALAKYRDVIHSTSDAGFSLWTATQTLATLQEGREFTISSDVLERADQFQIVRGALLEAPTVAGVPRLDGDHPWSLVDTTDFDDIDQEVLSQTIRSLHDASQVLKGLTSQTPQGETGVVLVADLAISSPSDFSEAADVIAAYLADELLTDEELQEIGTPSWVRQQDELLTKLRSIVGDSQQVRRLLDDSALESSTDTGPLIASGVEAVNAGFFSRKKKTQTFLTLAGPFIRQTGDPDTGELLRAFQSVPKLQADLQSVRENAGSLPGFRVPSKWPDLNADPEAAEDAIAAVVVRAEAFSGEAANALRVEFASGWQPTTEVLDALRTAATSWTGFGELVGATDRSIVRWQGTRGFFEAWIDAQPEWSDAVPRFLPLQRWIDVVRLLQPLSDVGLEAVRESLLSGDEAFDEALDMFLRGHARAGYNERLEIGRVDRFDGLAHDRSVESFSDLEKKRRELMRTVIPRRLVENRPFKPGTRVGLFGQVERELSKVRRKLSIRGLMARYGDAIPTLMPCSLMSPDSVARFLPADSVEFDTVVFDEASQIPVADAIGAMGRAKAVIVVGDSQQMPPSTAFGGRSTAVDEEESGGDDEPTFEDLESILSECVESNLPRLYLECHYRSRHEALITFSNQAFYEGRLTTFPSPAPAGSNPVKFHKVDGEFLRTGTGDDLRTNPQEARAVVDDILRRINDPETRRQSICVVTLNIQQQTLIRRLLEESGDDRISALLEDESDDGMIIRNLESVQGDERDVVMLSVAFAHEEKVDKDGNKRRKLPLRFGPLNNKGGERRLNVAVTRAREELAVFCSFDPDEMRLSENPSRGPALLKEFLLIARDGAERSGDLIARRPSDPDRHREAVAQALRDRGLQVRENVGLSKFRIDIAVGPSGSDEWTTAILLDGPGWAARTTSNDRDVLPPAVLRMMGWPSVKRIWLPAWQEERDRILDEIEEATNNPQPEPESEPEPEPEPEPTLPPAAVSEPELEGADPFEAAPTEALDEDLGLLDLLPAPKATRRVAKIIDEILAVEAPIHDERLARIVGRRCGMQTVRATRAKQILGIVSAELREESELGLFIWSTSRTANDWTAFRSTPAEVKDRQIGHIAPQEILNAMLHVVGSAFAVEPEELLRETSKVLGFAKCGAQVRKRIEAVLTKAGDAGKLVSDGEMYRLPVL
jgi:hypothetical protein